jgi:hypothetical protein
MRRLNHLVNGAFEAVSLEDILNAPAHPHLVAAGAPP